MSRSGTTLFDADQTWCVRLPSAAQVGAIQLSVVRFVPAAAGPEIVVIEPRPFAYRASGDFGRGKVSADGPLVKIGRPAPLEIMKYQVSAADYAQCVAAGACRKADPRRHGTGNLPVTGVSFNDATDYADWLSRRTGESALSTDGPAKPEPLGSFGVNEFGVADLSAVVWEWTATCASRTSLDASGNTMSYLESCGVRYPEGRHRTPMSAFVRDAPGGGCSVGVPPDNLGFRLVRDPSGLALM
jgi:formylglycine-generating enzyme required for sulfatase activity